MTRRKEPPHPPRRRGGLSEEDHALWEGTAGTIRPLKRKGRVHPAVAEDKTAAPSLHAKRSHPVAKKPSHEPAAPPAVRAAPGPPLAKVDPRQHRKVRSGRREIDRRIDLHGMRQSEAHAALRRFLFDSHARGCRWVLVITGKGAPRRRDSDELWGGPEPGVLKRSVPMWLADPELRPIVVSYTAAAVQHGGDGALYVHLRRVREDA